MSPETMDDPNTLDPLQHDPLLKPGAFIDPTPSPNSNPTSNCKGNVISIPDPVPTPTPNQLDQKIGSSGPVDVTDPANRPDWLPSAWLFKETLRTSGASAGTKDKYFIEPSTNHRFRSKKEVFSYLETGFTPKQQKRKSADSGIVTTPQPKTETSKRKKVGAKTKDSMKNFNFDDVPAKVKWELTDVFEGKWRPLINSVDRVPESSKQEWAAAFTYLGLQNGSRA